MSGGGQGRCAVECVGYYGLAGKGERGQGCGAVCGEL